MLVLDHIAVLGETLTEASAYVETRLGMALQPGGPHARYGTHNQIIGLDPDLYIEAIAIDPAAPAPADARWFGLDSFAGPPRLDKWICRVPDLDAALKALPMAGRRQDLERGDLSWSMAVPDDGQLPFDGLFPALIQWHSPVSPGQALDGAGLGLTQLTVAHPDAVQLSALLAPHLDAPLVRFETAAAPMLRAQIALGAQEMTL